jgi:uncharacterized protein (TIRG00374 family)
MFKKYFDKQAIAELISLIVTTGEHIVIKSNVTISNDPKDNFLLELGIIFLMIIFSYKQQWTLKAINWSIKLGQRITFGRWKTEKIKNQAFEITEHFHNAMTEFRHNPKSIATSLFYLVVTWIFSLSVPYLIFLSLDYPISWSMILITSSIVLAVKSIPVGIPFEVGLPEAVMTTLYFSMGVPAALAATATILIRIITLWMRFFIGFAAQQYLEFKPHDPTTANPEKTKIHLQL